MGENSVNGSVTPKQSSIFNTQCPQFWLFLQSRFGNFGALVLAPGPGQDLPSVICKRNWNLTTCRPATTSCFCFALSRFQPLRDFDVVVFHPLYVGINVLDCDFKVAFCSSHFGQVVLIKRSQFFQFQIVVEIASACGDHFAHR